MVLTDGLVQSLLEIIVPTWMNVSLRMKDDPETDKAFGWVLEMWVVFILCLFDSTIFHVAENADIISIYLLIKVCICCSIFITRCKAYSSQRFYDSGLCEVFSSSFFILQISVDYRHIIYLHLCHISATMGFGSWKELHHPLHIWLWLWYEGKWLLSCHYRFVDAFWTLIVCSIVSISCFVYHLFWLVQCPGTFNEDILLLSFLFKLLNSNLWLSRES